MGGIYLDTDVELLHDLDEFLNQPCFLGFESELFVNNGLGFGAEKGNDFIRENLNIYENISFVNVDGSLNMTPCPKKTTELLVERGLKVPNKGNKVQQLKNVTVYPKDYFSPYDWHTNTTSITKNTVSIHHFMSSWMSAEQKQNLIIQYKKDRIQKRFGNIIASIYEIILWKLYYLFNNNGT